MSPFATLRFQADNGDGTYRIEYDDGDVSRRKPASKIRLLDEQPGSPRSADSDGGLTTSPTSSPTSSPAESSAGTSNSTVGEAASQRPMSRSEIACSHILQGIHHELTRAGFTRAAVVQSPRANDLGVYPAVCYLHGGNRQDSQRTRLCIVLRGMLCGMFRTPTLTIYVGTYEDGSAVLSDCRKSHEDAAANDFFKINFALPAPGRAVSTADVEKRTNLLIVQRVLGRPSGSFTVALALHRIGFHPQQRIMRWSIAFHCMPQLMRRTMHVHTVIHHSCSVFCPVF